MNNSNNSTITFKSFLKVIAVTAFLILIMTFFVSCSEQMTSLSTTGRYLSAKNGTGLIIVDESPIVMTDANDKDLFKGLSDGDLIIITHSEVAESYPAKTRVYSLKKKSDGSIEDISRDVLESLMEMGWIESDKKE